MMIMFQDKIIYMPGVPPFARSERVKDYVGYCQPVEWSQESIRSLDGTNLSLLRGTMNGHARSFSSGIGDITDVIICYFQGNGSSLPPRLPLLSSVLKLLSVHSSQPTVRYTIVALSYRGYWSSSGRATQSGIELDARVFLEHVTSTKKNRNAKLILWGQSIGAGIAATAAAAYISRSTVNGTMIASLILETPFTSISSMLVALYPQRWLPYRYLSPFLWNHWDTEAALRKIARSETKPDILLLPGTRDEVVPASEADRLEDICSQLRFNFRRKDIAGALHHEVSMRRDGQQTIARFIADASHSNDS
jgi:uncharacterized protein